MPKRVQVTGEEDKEEASMALQELLEDSTTKRFLAYECNYKKHKGKTWLEVYNQDKQYFEWVMTVMNPTTRTYQVLSRLCSEATREKNRINTAFKIQKLTQ